MFNAGNECNIVVSLGPQSALLLSDSYDSCKAGDHNRISMQEIWTRGRRGESRDFGANSCPNLSATGTF